MDLIFDKEEVTGLKGAALKDQLKLFKNAGAPNLNQGPLPTLVGDIYKALTDAIDLHTNSTLGSSIKMMRVRLGMQVMMRRSRRSRKKKKRKIGRMY